MDILRCDKSHAEILAELGRKTYFDTFSAMNTEETMNLYLEEAFNIDGILQELQNPASQFYILMDGKKTAAYLKVNFSPAQTDLNDPESLEVERIYVREEYKKRGLGRCMMQKADEIARDSGCRYIWLGVWEKNTSAIAFYKRSGFIQFDRHFFRMGEELQQDFLLRKSLD